ncbi:hypothetical protein [Pseudomonas sp. PDM13]|uniref:hypothetical protein n=1 Tax=Pseudomonas sp. PDM13 TaxID=2769255 RepID=UPI00295B1354|nr:hypothetical protein [Pseudomonas sp. PDM13]
MDVHLQRAARWLFQGEGQGIDMGRAGRGGGATGQLAQAAIAQQLPGALGTQVAGE